MCSPLCLAAIKWEQISPSDCTTFVGKSTGIAMHKGSPTVSGKQLEADSRLHYTYY